MVLVNQTVSKLCTQVMFSSLRLALVPGRLYEAEVTAHSGTLSNTARCLGRLGKFDSFLLLSEKKEFMPADENEILIILIICQNVFVITRLICTAPGAVQQLLLRHSDESSVSVQWTQPPGEWDGFTVVLRQADLATIVAQRSLSLEVRECTFNSLTSGRPYTVTVTTNSGNMTSSASVTAHTGLSELFNDFLIACRTHCETRCLSWSPGPGALSVSAVLSLWSLSAPAQVTRLQVSNGGSTDSLQTTWERASGDLDSYRVLLVHDSSVIKNQSVEADTTSISFHSLRPGALYRVVVTTVRAGHTSRQTVAEGRTGNNHDPSITGTNRLHVSTERQREVHVEHLLNEQEGPNNAEFIKCLQLNNSLN